MKTIVVDNKKNHAQSIIDSGESTTAATTDGNEQQPSSSSSSNVRRTTENISSSASVVESSPTKTTTTLNQAEQHDTDASGKALIGAFADTCHPVTNADLTDEDSTKLAQAVILDVTKSEIPNDIQLTSKETENQLEVPSKERRNKTTRSKKRTGGNKNHSKKKMDPCETQTELLSSQYSSQASTSLVSSSIYNQDDEDETCSSSSSAFHNNSQHNNGNRSGKLEDHFIYINQESPACKLKRTAISQSMLNLDQNLYANERFDVVWLDLSFNYRKTFISRMRSRNCNTKNKQQPEQQPTVLRNLSGHFKSNELVAIIGPSGCGKTTLLQFLAGNQACQRDRMRIVGLDEPKVAFIGQDDDLLPGLTARETLIYASRLQNTMPGFNHDEHIQPILNELGLAECAHRNVTKLSGGQMKRVTIAQELLYPTNLLILDEVTSGLDASTSYSIVKLLKYLVSDSSYPMSIVMSIHQPSARLFSVFDRVYVMSEGSCLYEGSCQIEEINKYLKQFNLQCPKYHNIADYLIEIASISSADMVTSNGKLSVAKSNGDQMSIHDEEDDSASRAASPVSIGCIKEQMIEYQRQKNQDLLASVCKDYLRVAKRTGVSRDPLEHNEDNFILTSDKPTTQNNNNKEQCVSLLMNPLTTGIDMNPGNNSEDNNTRNNNDTFEQQMVENHSLFDAIERARFRRQRPFFEQFLVHFSRSLLRIRRSVILTYLQMITYIILGVQLATFYGGEIGLLSGCPRLPGNLMSYVMQASTTSASSNSSVLDQEELMEEMRRIQENMNFLLVTVMTATFAALEITVITFPMEAKTVKREWRNGWYKVTSYFMGRTMADLPFTTLFVLMFSLLVYSMTGQIGLTTWRFAIFFSIVLATALVAQSFGFIFGAAFMDNLPAAVFTAPLAIFPTLLFSGFFSRVSQIPSFYRPLTHLSHFRYCFDALLVTLYGYNRCECDQAALDTYHANVRNQTESMRDMFQMLFGGGECSPPESTGGASLAATTNAPALQDDNMIAHEDAAAISAANSTLGAQLKLTISTAAPSLTLSSAPTATLSSSTSKHPLINSLEDAIVDTLFEHMTKNSTTLNGTSSTTGVVGPMSAALTMTNSTAFVSEAAVDESDMSALDRLSYRFSTQLSRMISKQANFGHQMPRDCSGYNSYLMQEFGLHDLDLIHGLWMLILFVLFTRLLCSLILNFTIATRAR